MFQSSSHSLRKLWTLALNFIFLFGSARFALHSGKSNTYSNFAVLAAIEVSDGQPKYLNLDRFLCVLASLYCLSKFQSEGCEKFPSDYLTPYGINYSPFKIDFIQR